MDEYQQHLQELRSKRDRRWSWPQFSIALCLIPVAFLMWLGGMSMAIQPRPAPTTYLLGVVCAGASPLVALGGAIWLLVLLYRRFWHTR